MKKNEELMVITKTYDLVLRNCNCPAGIRGCHDLLPASSTLRVRWMDTLLGNDTRTMGSGYLACSCTRHAGFFCKFCPT